MYSKYHYLNTNLGKQASCYELYINGKNAAFCAIINFPHPVRSYYKVHRLVVLPDYQGLGLGSFFVKELAVRSKKPFAITTSQPALINSFKKNKEWILTRKMRGLKNHGPLGKLLNRTASLKRIIFTFVFKKSIWETKKI